MNKKKFYIVGGALLALLLVALVFYQTSGSQDGVGLAESKFKNWESPLANEADLTEEALLLFKLPGSLDYDELMDKVRRGEINLLSHLRALRRQCPETMSRYDCDLRIRQLVRGAFAPPGNEKIAGLLVDYLKYEEAMQNTQMPADLKGAERYAWIKARRRELMSEQSVQLLFGLQEAKVATHAGYARILTDMQGRSGGQKMEAYEAMRREQLGDYYEAVVQREEPFTAYDREQRFFGDELQQMPEAERQSTVRSMREKYFGAAGAERMAAVDAKYAARDAKLAELQKAEAAYLQSAVNLPAGDREAGLRKLREEKLGQTEAAAYERRLKMRQGLANLSKQSQ